MSEEVKFLWRDTDAGEDDRAIDLVNSFLDGVKASGFTEKFKLHVVQNDNKIDFNIAVKAVRATPEKDKDSILNRMRSLRTPGYGAANTWVFNALILI